MTDTRVKDFILWTRYEDETTTHRQRLHGTIKEADKVLEGIRLHTMSLGRCISSWGWDICDD